MNADVRPPPPDYASFSPAIRYENIERVRHGYVWRDHQASAASGNIPNATRNVATAIAQVHKHDLIADVFSRLRTLLCRS
jgi:hypothetical protein